MPSLPPPWSPRRGRLAAALALALAVGGCNTLERLSQVGEAPELTTFSER